MSRINSYITTNESRALVQAAIKAAKHAYAPYSNYPVGAAIKALDGTIYGGCNVENAAYPASICAERVALVKAVSEGQRQFESIAVVTHNGGAPCGICRQALYEFAPDLLVIIADMDGKVHTVERLYDLLPHGFGPSSLG